jgi:hypothetical protein
MEKTTALPHLTDLNKRATLTQLSKDLTVLHKYQHYVTFSNAIETLIQEIGRVEKE